MFRFRSVTAKVNKFPILGRDKELAIYLNNLDIFNDQFRTSLDFQEPTELTTCILINGRARQGATRLLDEIVYLTPTSIPINRFTLEANDANV